MKNNLHTLVFSIIAAWFCPIAASGEIVTFDFTGGVSDVYNPFSVASPSLVQVGDPVQVSLRFDTATPDANPEANWGTFFSPGWLKVGINRLNFECTTTIRIDILHGANGGQELFQAVPVGSPTAWPEVLPTYPYQYINFAFFETGPPYDFLSNANLPSDLDFSRADIRGGSVSTGTSTLNMYEIRFNLVQVPEPAVASLLAGGLLMWWLMYQARVDKSGAVGACPSRYDFGSPTTLCEKARGD